MKIRLFSSDDVQDLYGVVVPHLDYSRSLTEREESIRNSKTKVKKRELQQSKEQEKVQNVRIKNRKNKRKTSNELEF